LGVIIALLGLALAAGGVRLVSLGGSWYFLIGGVAMALAGLLIARRNTAGAWLFAAFLAGTPSGRWRMGLVFWPLFSRLFMFAVIGLVALVYPLLAGKPARGAGAGAGVLAVVVAWRQATCSSLTPASRQPATALASRRSSGDAQKDWAHYGNTEGGSRFAALDQINRANVDKLKVAWTYHTGDVALSDGNGAEDQLTPLQIGNKVFICTPTTT
jgi:quinate dehydrogenase (quinone)